MFKPLGNLEESVLLIVAIMYHQKVYGFSVVLEYKKQTGKSISIQAVHTVLKRLEQKGYLTSSLGEATQKRGGKRKRVYKITHYGYQALAEIQASRTRLWNLIPHISFE